MREVVLDTETTGLDPADGHRVLEIGAVEIVHQSLTGNVFHVLINPERDIPEDAVRVHGHTVAILKDKPVFASIVDDFLAFIGDSNLVIHNADFDVRFMNAELARLGLDAIAASRVVDTLALARKRHPGQPNSLDALCDRYRIDRTRRVRHGALLDAEILVEVYCELMGGRQRSFLLDDALEVAGTAIVDLAPRYRERPQRQLAIDAVEAAAHVQYIESFGRDAIWFQYLPQPTPA
jgi:DNA polymerase-3 subunit epsilon